MATCAPSTAAPTSRTSLPWWHALSSLARADDLMTAMCDGRAQHTRCAGMAVCAHTCSLAPCLIPRIPLIVSLFSVTAPANVLGLRRIVVVQPPVPDSHSTKGLHIDAFKFVCGGHRVRDTGAAGRTAGRTVRTLLAACSLQTIVHTTVLCSALLPPCDIACLCQVRNSVLMFPCRALGPLCSLSTVPYINLMLASCFWQGSLVCPLFSGCFIFRGPL